MDVVVRVLLKQTMLLISQLCTPKSDETEIDAMRRGSLHET